jgi:hypothetical protein
MKRGPQSSKLSLDQITLLRKIQMRRRDGIPQLAEFMKAPFRWQTLSQALRGRPIRLINYQFIVDWLASERSRTGKDEQKTETRGAEPRPAQMPAVRGGSD